MKINRKILIPIIVLVSIASVITVIVLVIKHNSEKNNENNSGTNAGTNNENNSGTNTGTKSGGNTGTHSGTNNENNSGTNSGHHSGSNTGTKPGGNTDLSSQPDSSINIVNNTSENPLHVFLQLNTVEDPSEQWKQIGGDPKALRFNPVNWGMNEYKKIPSSGLAWNPLGSKVAVEVVIPKGGNILLQIPDKVKPTNVAWIIMAVKMLKDSWEQTLPRPHKPGESDRPINVAYQSSILIEGGKDMVADSSAVDGINYRMEYLLTTENQKTKRMIINENPCQNLDKTIYSKGLTVGCVNPAKVDCSKACVGKTAGTCNSDSADCKSYCKAGNQVCAFNECSKILFDFSSPENTVLLNKYNTWGGSCDKGNAIDPSNGNKPNQPPVKTFINNSNNLKNGSPLDTFCKQIQKNGGDFTPYCYDYNDTSSSPTLSAPYKIRLTYMDL